LTQFDLLVPVGGGHFIQTGVDAGEHFVSRGVDYPNRIFCGEGFHCIVLGSGGRMI